MKPQVPSGYEVKYRHLRNFVEPLHKLDVDEMPQLSEKGGRTVALLYREGSDVPVVRGFALCHPNDNFSRKLGRRIALGRALKELE